MLPHLSWLALGLATTAVAQDAGSIVEAGDTLVSAMMVRFSRYSACWDVVGDMDWGADVLG